MKRSSFDLLWFLFIVCAYLLMGVCIGMSIQ